MTGEDWRANLIETTAGIDDLLRSARRVAVLGMKTEAQADQPAYYVAEYASKAGLDVIPVPVYYPEAKTILGHKVYRKLADIPVEVDIVDVFRKGSDIPAHVDDILKKRPRAVWFQSGIRHDEVAEQLARAGIDVVQDHCLMVELQARGR